MSSDEENDSKLDLSWKKKRNVRLKFSECIAKIGGDNSKFGRCWKVKADEGKTCFVEALTKWNDQNHSSEYASFLSQLPIEELETYAQLIHHRDKIFQAIFQNLVTQENVTSIPACSELICALAQDLKVEFADYVWKSTDILAKFLDSNSDPEYIESAFNGLCLLVKVQWKSFVKNVKKTFTHFVPLFASKKQYVRRLAAEAFAFLMRKLPDLRGITEYLVQTSFKSSDATLDDGISLIYFYMCRGISGGFHSNVKQFLEESISAVLNVTDFEVKTHGVGLISGMVRKSIEYCMKKKSEKNLIILEDSLHVMLGNAADMLEANQVLELLSQLYMEKNHLHNCDKLFKAIVSLSQSSFFSCDETFLRHLSKVLVQITWPPAYFVRIRDLVCNVTSRTVHLEKLVEFFRSTISASFYDLYLMPSISNLGELVFVNPLSDCSRVFLRLYAEICALRRPIHNCFQRVREPFFNTTQHMTLRKIVSYNVGNLESLDFSIAADTVCVWPWIFGKSEKVFGIEEVSKWLILIISGRETYPENVSSQLALIAASALYQVDKNALKYLDQEAVLRFMEKYDCCHSCLLLFKLYLSSQEELSNVDRLMKLCTALRPALFSPTAAKRKMALEIMSLFHVTNEQEENIFSILLDAESCELVDSRSRLRHFRRLVYGVHLTYLPCTLSESRDVFEKVILEVALSQFFVQFTLLWPGMHELLLSYARNLDIDKFCDTFVFALHEVQSACQSSLRGISPKKQCSTGNFHYILQSIDQDDRTDFESARLQLLRFLAKIPDLTERRSRLFVPFCLDLYRNEFLLLQMHSSSFNKQTTSTDTKVKIEKSTIFNTVKALSSFLDVFSRFSDAKSVYLECELRKIYFELLCYGNEDLIKTSLKCILSYKYKSVLPYKENLLAFAENKTFRDQLVIFKISEEEDDAVVSAENRPDVMGILLRLLYGKLCIPSKASENIAKKQAIFQYIGGCRPCELQLFLEIIFADIISCVGDGPDMVEKMKSFCLDISKVKNVKHMCLKLALENTAGLIKRIPLRFEDEQKTFLLRILFCISVVIQTMLDSEFVETYRKTQVKQLRIDLSNTLCTFFSAFPSRQTTSQEVSHLVELLVRPHIEQCKSNHGDVIAIAPQSTIRLLERIASLPSYCSLLSVQICLPFLQKPCSLMDLLIWPLLWKGLTQPLQHSIVNCLIALLKTADEKPVVELQHISRLRITYLDGANYGTSLVVCHMLTLLQYLGSNSTDGKGKHLSEIASKNLEMLNRISDYVIDNKIGRNLSTYLISYLEHGVVESTCQQMLNTLSRLVKNVSEPEELLRRTVPLFSRITGRSNRIELASVVCAFVDNEQLQLENKDVFLLARELESYDKQRVDELDFDRRHAAYIRLLEFYGKNYKLSVDFCILLLHSLYFTIVHTTDISIRRSAGTNLRALIEYMSKNFDDHKDFLLNKHLIPLTVLAFKCPDEMVREEFVNGLVVMIDRFPSHFELSTLCLLRNADQDLDFFVNLIHIQLHRRQRAMSRLSRQIEEKKLDIPFSVLNRFIVPLIYHDFSVVNSKNTTLSDAAVHLLYCILLSAPWSRYKVFLDSWLNKLSGAEKDEKPIIRVLVAIIDAFHFDVADAEEAVDSGINSALTIRDKITQNVLPRLQKCIDGKGGSDVHRKAQTVETKIYYEDDDIQRAPVALATVKLLLKLPEHIRVQHLHGVVLKLCSLMISRSNRVRDVARKVTLQVVEALGSKYLPYIVREMYLLMNKGFQLHVMIFTVHSLVSASQERLSIGDLDDCLNELLDISIKDQFENVADEKVIVQIKSTVSEARGDKTPDTFFLLGRFISRGAVSQVLDKLRDVLESKTSSKDVSKIGYLLSKFANGLKENFSMSSNAHLILAHQVLAKYLVKMECSTAKAEDKNVLRAESCLIIPEAPRRIGAIVKTSTKSRAHIFVEFGLQLISQSLIGKRVEAGSAEYVARLNPFASVITRCLALKYDKVVLHSLRCLNLMLQLQLPAFLDQLDVLSKRLFVILADYSALGNAGNKDSVLQLNQLLFKCFTRLISIGDVSLIEKNNLDLLLSYIETDVLDSQKQATAFALIKSIVRKKLQHDRLLEVIQRLAELSVTSTVQQIRTQSRDTVLIFVVEHPDAGDAAKYLEFFAAQLEYEFADGRLSAAESLHLLFANLPTNVLDNNSYSCLVKLGAQLVSDDVPKCRRFMAGAIRKLLENVSAVVLNDIASACYEWLSCEKESLRSVGVEVLVQMSFVEGESFSLRLPNLVKIVTELFSPDFDISEHSENAIICLLDGLTHISKNCGLSNGLCESITILEMLSPLCCCHISEVQRAASEYIGQVLSKSRSLCEIPILTSELVSKITDWMLWQLRGKKLTESVADQASKNLVCLSAWLNDEDFTALIGKLEAICRYEVSHQPRNSLKRIACFKLTAAIAVHEKREARHKIFVDYFMPLLVREINRKSSFDSDTLFNISTEVATVIKQKIGDEDYSKIFAECQKNLIQKSEDRKRKLKELALVAPQEAADLKRKKNVKKVDLRKRKLDRFKPYRVAKRKHLEEQRLLRDEE